MTITVMYEGNPITTQPKKCVNSVKRAYRTSKVLSVFKPGERLTTFEIQQRLEGEHFDIRRAVYNMKNDGVLVLEVAVTDNGIIYQYHVRKEVNSDGS